MTTFKVKARVLLELGAELISSDSIALYELIKNSIDAQAKRIEVKVSSILTATGYYSMVQEIKGLSGRKIPRDFLDKNLHRFVDANAPKALQAKLVELLEGAPTSSAETTLRDFYCEYTSIEIVDDGVGMSSDDLAEKFMTIGTPHRALQRGGGGASKLLGEKGIGRLSAMRLGDILALRTTKQGETNWSKLTVDWANLGDEKNLDLDLGKFEVAIEKGPEKKNRDSHGTSILISGLKSDWFRHHIETIARAELSKLQDPFDRKTPKLDLRLKYNGHALDDAIEELDAEWLKGWHGTFHIRFGYERDEDNVLQPKLTGTVKYRVPRPVGIASEVPEEIDEDEVDKDAESIFSILADPNLPVTRGGQQTTPARYAGIGTLGSFEARGWWYNRQRKKAELPKDDYNEVFRPWLEQWGGGLLMYRDGFRVYPYAEPDDDWLELDQKALKRKSFKLNRGQFTGFVRISSATNKFLRDQTNRQGLVDTAEKKRLIQCLQYVIWDCLGVIVKKHELKSAKRALGSIAEIDQQVKTKTKEAQKALNQLSRKAPEQSPLIESLRDHVDELEVAWGKAKSTIKRQQAQADVYLHLAGVGILLEFIVHELTRVTKDALTDLNSMPDSKLSPGFRSLTAQLKTLQKRLRILDPVSTPGRQIKEEVDVPDIIGTLIDAHSEQFERHRIIIDWPSANRAKRLVSKVVVGQVYQIFENFISNSVYWLGHHRAVLAETKRNVNRFVPTISIEVDPSERRITFRDNGLGIQAGEAKKVFEALYSNKPQGRGLGLYIAQRLCDENNIQLRLLDANERDAHPGFDLIFS